MKGEEWIIEIKGEKTGMSYASVKLWKDIPKILILSDVVFTPEEFIEAIRKRLNS